MNNFWTPICYPIELDKCFSLISQAVSTSHNKISYFPNLPLLSIKKFDHVLTKEQTKRLPQKKGFIAYKDLNKVFENHLHLKNDTPILWRQITSGFWLLEPVSGESFYIQTSDNIHLPLVLCQILMQFIKALGLLSKSILIHGASTLNINEEATLIIGAQNRGKTTLSKNLKSGIILNDDLSLVQILNNKPYIYQVPDLNNPIDPNDPFRWKGPYPIKKIIYIRRKQSPKILELTPNISLNYYKEEGPFFDYTILNNFLDKHTPTYKDLVWELLNHCNSYCISYNAQNDKEKILEQLVKLP